MYPNEWDFALQVITLAFSALHLEGNECRYDYVAVYDGQNHKYEFRPSVGLFEPRKKKTRRLLLKSAQCLTLYQCFCQNWSEK